MKKLNLLLATTAILSTGAIVANATSELAGMEGSTSLPIKAEIVAPMSFEPAVTLDFGRIAWAFDGGSSSTVTFVPDSDGGTNPDYNRVKFHEGGQLGKVCFTDIVPDADLGEELHVTVDYASFYDSDSHLIAGYNGTGDNPNFVADAGAEDGIRCIYVGGEFEGHNNEYGRAFSGNITGSTTVTVMYDSVN